MAVCQYCNKEMRIADGCDPAPIMIDGIAYEPVRYGFERGWGPTRGRCGDCRVLPGAVHHHCCDVEPCPCCGDQSISCDCIWDGEEHLSDEWMEELEERFMKS